MGTKIKRNDRVEIIAGKDNGKRTRVLHVLTDRSRVLLEGVGLIKKHVKPNPQRNIKGGIAERESPIHLSNVMLLDSDGKRSRVGSTFVGTKKVRRAISNGEMIAEKK